MKKDQHSPGPWSVYHKDGETEIITAENESIMCDMTYYPWVPESQADWDLIAAAPELLAACVEFVRKVDAGEARSKKSYAQMKSAINKARGEKE